MPALNSKPDEFAVLEATPNDVRGRRLQRRRIRFLPRAVAETRAPIRISVVADAGEILSMLPVNTGCDADLAPRAANR